MMRASLPGSTWFAGAGGVSDRAPGVARGRWGVTASKTKKECESGNTIHALRRLGEEYSDARRVRTSLQGERKAHGESTSRGGSRGRGQRPRELGGLRGEQK